MDSKSIKKRKNNPPCAGRLLAYALIGVLACSFPSCDDKLNNDGKGGLIFNVSGINEQGDVTRAGSFEPETMVVTADDGTPIECTLSIDPAPLTRSTSNMATGNKYRVIVYEKLNDGTYKYATEQVFTAGTAGRMTDLPWSDTKELKVVAISYNSTDEPPAVGSSATTITVDPEKDLLHYVSGDITVFGYGHQSIQPTSQTVNIVFKHCFARITVQVDASETGDPVNAVADATLTPNYKGVLTLINGTIDWDTPNFNPAKTGSSDPANTTVFSWTGLGSAMIVASNTRTVFAPAVGTLYLTFASGGITVGTHNIPGPIMPFFDMNTPLKPGYKYTLNVKVRYSISPYISPGDVNIESDDGGNENSTGWIGL
jgi:hypothetical protein